MTEGAKTTMPITPLDEKFVHELADIYDAEHRFLKGQEEMLAAATRRSRT